MRQKSIFTMTTVALIFLCSTLSAGEKWKYSMSLGAGYNSGDVNHVDLKNSGEVQRNDSLISLNINYKFVYSREDKEVKNKGLNANAKVDLFQYARWSPFVAAEFLTNQFKGYDYKIGVLGGCKYRIYSKPSVCDYSLSAAFMYDIVDYTPTERDDERYYRLSIRPKIKQKIGETVTFLHYTFYKPNICNFRDYYIDSFSQVECHIKNHFYLDVNFEYEYRSVLPSDDYKRREITTEVALKVKF